MKKINKFLFSTLLAGTLAVGAINQLAPANEISVGADTVPAPIELVEGGAFVRSTLNAKNLGVSSATFSSIALEVTTSKANAADSNWWGWPAVHLGLSDEGTVDLSGADSLNIQLSYITKTGYNQRWVKWFAVDGDGDVVAVNDFGNDKGTWTTFGGTTGNILGASDWRGTWVGDPGVLYSYKEQRGTNANFNWDRVHHFIVSIHAWDAKGVNIGSMSYTKDGVETILFDADEAQQITYAQVYNGVTEKKANTMKVGTNEWYFGGNMDAGKVDKDPAGFAEQGITASYTKADDNVFEFKKASNSSDSWTGINPSTKLGIVNTAGRYDISNYDGITFYADTTGVTGQSQIDFLFRTASGDYKSYGHASFYNENGTLVNNVPGNKIPSGFKGRVVVPFSTFYSGNKPLTNDTNLSSAQFMAIVVPGPAAVGDVVKVSDIKIVAQATKEANLLTKLGAFTSSFEMLEGAGVRLDDPTGIRFGATVATQALLNVSEALTGVDYEIGTIIVPNEAAYANAQPNQAGVLTIKKSASGAPNGANYEFYAAMVNVKTTNYEREFIAKSYLQYTLNGETFTVWAKGTTGARSIYGVAKAAYADGLTDNEYINGIIATVEAN